MFFLQTNIINDRVELILLHILYLYMFYRHGGSTQSLNSAGSIAKVISSGEIVCSTEAMHVGLEFCQSQRF